MSVEITFEQDGGNGLVAEGTSLWEAARRLGVRLQADCHGRGECDACAVLIIQGGELLSPANELEKKVLSPERLAATERLACQTKLHKTGEVVVRLAPIAASAARKNKSSKAFRDLSLRQQVGALIELEATTISEAVNTLRGKSNALIEKVLNLKPKTASTQAHNGEGKAPIRNN